MSAHVFGIVLYYSEVSSKKWVVFCVATMPYQTFNSNNTTAVHAGVPVNRSNNSITKFESNTHQQLK
jgi:hypothetical protein